MIDPITTQRMFIKDLCGEFAKGNFDTAYDSALESHNTRLASIPESRPTRITGISDTSDPAGNAATVAEALNLLTGARVLLMDIEIHSPLSMRHDLSVAIGMIERAQPVLRGDAQVDQYTPRPDRKQRKAGAFAFATEIVRTALADGAEHPARPIIEAVESAGFNKSVCVRVRNALGVRVRRADHRRWVWSMPLDRQRKVGA